MLPTQTLNPTAVASATGKAKRDDSQIAMEMDEPINIIGDSHLPVSWDADKFWWAGVGLVAVGGVLYMYPASK
ncbi:Reversal of tor2 lethality [Neophaeococcomyces mojaviensis]|uniref:Reversal of tor2 lethality n=1 Tax=Neophaeococcomyces mojaviensis TaxID=3383035 RepID=A0ACC2ZUJ2_9EURO|nr:Reversal of tor2 lethality [Knufia sp. JES_112]